MSKNKFNALAAVKLMAAENDDDAEDQAENKNSEQDDISSFLNVKFEESMKPIKGILKRRDDAITNDALPSTDPEMSDESVDIPVSKPQPLATDKVSSKENIKEPNIEQFVLKVKGLPFEMKSSDFVTFLGIWPRNGYDGIKVICDSAGDPAGYVYVEVESQKDKMAILRATGLKFKNSVVQISSSTINEMELEWVSTQRIFKQIEKSPFIRIGNLRFTMSKIEVTHMLRKYKRQPEDIYLTSDKPGQQNNGYCYVIMDSKEQAEEICKFMQMENSGNLIIRKIHPEVLGRWCRRNQIKLILREGIDYDMTVNVPSPQLEDNAEHVEDSKVATSKDMKISSVENEINADPKSNVFVYDADNLESIVPIEPEEGGEKNEASSLKDVGKERKIDLIDDIVNSNLVVYDVGDAGSNSKSTTEVSKSTPKQNLENKTVRRNMSDPHTNPPNYSPGPFPFPPQGPPIRPFLRNGMPFDPVRFPYPPPARMGPPMFNPRFVGPPMRPPLDPRCSPMGSFVPPRGLHMPHFAGPRAPPMGPPMHPPTDPRNLPMRLPTYPRNHPMHPPNLSSPSKTVSLPHSRSVYDQMRPHPPFTFQPGFSPTIFVRMYDVPERTTTDDIKDFFHPVTPAKIAQNVGSDIYDVDFFNPNDAMIALKRSGLMIRKNVVRLEMLPGPFVPLPPRKMKAKKRKPTSDEASSKRRKSPVSVHLGQPPPMPVTTEVLKPKVQFHEQSIVVAPFPEDPLEYHLKPFDASIPEGQCVIQPMKGYFCQVCRKFYKNESSALIVHCRSKSHYDNTKMYLEKLKTKRDLSRADPRI